MRIVVIGQGYVGLTIAMGAAGAFFVPSTVAAELCALAVLAVKEADKTKPSGQTKINLFFMFEFLLLNYFLNPDPEQYERVRASV